MKLFISWSGKVSGDLAKIIKRWLTTSVFPHETLVIFVSEEDIGAGASWLEVVKHEMMTSDCALIVITKSNIDAPWLNFEAGGIAVGTAEARKVIPLLVDTSIDEIKSPLKHFQSISLAKPSIRKLIEDLKRAGAFTSPSHIEDSFDRLYNVLMAEVSAVRRQIEEDYVHDQFSIFPTHVRGLKRGKVFVGVPMASANDQEYAHYKECALAVKRALLIHTDAREVYCPCEEITNRGQFEGYKSAIIKDFKILKESEHYIFIYPRAINSSILVEMGYAIALCKKTTIFARDVDDLPFMLKRANIAIPNLEIHTYQSASDIVEMIEREGDAFLKRVEAL